MELCDLPRDIIKLIIQFCPYGQWFRLSKELSILASQAISPLNYRTSKGVLHWALAKDKILAVISLLKDPRIDPSVEDNFAIRYASQNGYKAIVEILLKDNRVKPEDQHNYAIRWASTNGHKEIVEILLKDSRVNPADKSNYAIRYATMNGHKEIVKILLQDHRVNPSDENNFAIRFASQNGHREIVEMLLQDHRVNPANSSGLNLPSAVRIASEKLSRWISSTFK
jgi:ankyrin repeat protein